MAIQAKLKVFHEVVVRNRLEQLRKRQRDEALQAQEELLAGVVQSAQQGAHRPRTGVTASYSTQDETETYTRAMSPLSVDILTVTEDERQNVVSAEDELRELVRSDPLNSQQIIMPPSLFIDVLFPDHVTLPRHNNLSTKQLNSRLRPLQVPLSLPQRVPPRKQCIVQRWISTLTRKKRHSTRKHPWR